MGLKIGTEEESGTWWCGRVKEQEPRCLNVNELRDASGSCNLWTSATITVHCSTNQTWKRESGMERDVVHVCPNDRERRKRGRLKYNIPGLIYALGLLGPLLQTEYIHCAYSNFALQKWPPFELFEEQWYGSRWLEATLQWVFWERCSSSCSSWMVNLGRGDIAQRATQHPRSESTGLCEAWWKSSLKLHNASWLPTTITYDICLSVSCWLSQAVKSQFLR